MSKTITLLEALGVLSQTTEVQPEHEEIIFDNNYPSSSDCCVLYVPGKWPVSLPHLSEQPAKIETICNMHQNEAQQSGHLFKRA